MLDSETRRRIDTARDILVGKLPNPQAQVEQITIAMIYKFMDDMDKEAIELGGEPTFFTGDFEKYSWTKIFDPKLGGFEMLALYGEAIVKLNQNPNIPQLFRDIFKNAFLPYRDPETLKLFLKVINEFHYDHSEKLGDAFEYLLSVLGSQGDAGQFRTPRHIIDFIVSIVQPKKEETVCDPACGTAGFLISAYKHILAENTKKSKGDLLTPDDRKRLINNFTGYDISAEMVRLSLANMYLHGFATPHIYEYDTLTSEDRWGDYFDIILANPPFMTPKGGIRPHKKFAMQANRSEVLFVDYIMEHINPTTGRAAVIVPEGIIFQNASAYKELRKLLIEKSFLFGVVSLPGGIFQPYSGVKTSILLIDKSIAKKTDKILFVKIENDGFSLGAQRKEITQNDLPDASLFIKHYVTAVRENDFTAIGLESLPEKIFIVSKSEIASGGDYNLSSERYQVHNAVGKTRFEVVTIGDICEIRRGGSPRPIDDYLTTDVDGINWIKIGDVKEGSRYVTSTKEKIKQEGLSKTRLVEAGDFILSNSMSYGRPYIVKIKGAIHDGWLQLRIKEKQVILQDFLYDLLKSDAVKGQYDALATGGVVKNLNSVLVSNVKIPLPPISVQQDIVEKIELYEKIIAGATQVVESYRPLIEMRPEWEMVELDKLCEKITDGSHFSPPTIADGYPYITVKDIIDDKIDFENCKFIGENDYRELVKNGCKPLANDILFSKDGTVGKVSLVDFEKEFVVLSSLAIIRPNVKLVNPNFLKIVLQSDYFINRAIDSKTGVAIKRIVLKTLKTIPVPKIPLAEQEVIVNQIERERALVSGNKLLIEMFKEKINLEINKLWDK